MHRFFKTNLAYRIISILLAVILWMWVTTEKNPTQEKVLQVPLETRNLAHDLMVADKPDSVKIRIEGRKNLIDNVNSRDIRAFVNLQGATTGPNIKPVEVALPVGLQLVNVNPSQVSVAIDQISEAQLPVAVLVQGQTAPGYTSLEPSVTPTEVIVQGPKSLLDAIDQVFVEVTLDESPESLKEQLPLKIKDNRGRLIHDMLRTKPEFVEVYIPVLKETPSQKLLVKPAIIGKPAAGYRIKRVAVEPDIVEAYGPYQSLATLDYLTTESVLVSDLTSDLIQEVPVITPDEGITTQPKTVKVVVEVERE